MGDIDNISREDIKKFIKSSIDSCFSTYPISKQEMMEILVSLSADLVIEQYKERKQE